MFDLTVKKKKSWSVWTKLWPLKRQEQRGFYNNLLEEFRHEDEECLFKLSFFASLPLYSELWTLYKDSSFCQFSIKDSVSSYFLPRDISFSKFSSQRCNFSLVNFHFWSFHKNISSLPAQSISDWLKFLRLIVKSWTCSTYKICRSMAKD